MPAMLLFHGDETGEGTMPHAFLMQALRARCHCKFSANGVGELGAARHPRERVRGDENSAMIIERAFSVVNVTRNLVNQFAIRLENSRICTGKMNAFGMISQCLMAHPARHCATVLILHQEPNAVLF